MADELNDRSEQTSAAATESAPADTGEASELQKQRDEYYDRLLRMTAEFDNYRKRVERERVQQAEAAAAGLLQELLPIVDNLERAMRADSGTEGTDAYRRGVELIHSQLLDALRRRGVKPIEALGADFDPHYHEAVAHDHAEGRRDGEIIEEFSRGYLLGDRLLRPAMVKVAKG